MDIELLQTELFANFNEAEKPCYKGFSILKQVERQLIKQGYDFSIRNFRLTWSGQTTSKNSDTPRKIGNTRENAERMKLTIKAYESVLQRAKKEILESLDLEVVTNNEQ